MSDNKTSIGKFIYTFIVVMAVWMAFTTSLEPAELITGIIVSLIIAVFSSGFFSCCGLSILFSSSIIYVVQYFFVFIWALVKSNFSMAKRVISPSLPINPGIVEFKTNLKNETAKLILANSITLTPGTLTVDLIDDNFYIHWIDVEAHTPEEAYKAIAEPFEKILLKIFKD
ncbi:MAG: Na+/H+ antiporter subunit E [Flavobacteriales bacterium]|nr:Na+/H+ antiporter subunit E [Flavobacteriales bacterium]